MKRCNRCGVEKPLDAFHVQHHAPDGHRYTCKVCNVRAARQWNLDNKERANATCGRYQKRARAEGRLWHLRNKPRMAAYMREWRKGAVRPIAYKHGKRNAHAMPNWANTFVLKEAYRLAKLRTTMTGIPWEVDHIIPLNHPRVCGLHVEANIRVVPRTVNRAKGNRWSGDER